MVTDGLDDLRTRLAEVKERVRQERIERGQSPEPPEDFVPIALSIVLAERLESVVPIAVKYAGIIAGGSLIPIDLSKLVEHRKLAHLLCRSLCKSSKHTAGYVRFILSEMERMDAVIERGEYDEYLVNEVLRNLHFAIKMACSGYTRFRELTYEAEVERLKTDPAALNAELTAAWTQYEKIKHEV